MDSESTIAGATSLRIVIAGGGTGGHISPAVAVIEELRRRLPVEALWIGSRRGFERRAAADLGVPFRSIQTGKLRRYLSVQTPLDVARVPIGAVQSWRALRAFRPDVVFSTGGFVSVPSVLAARKLAVPTLTHEQTAHIGLATRINARVCDVVALSFERSLPLLGSTRARVIVTGNPVRAAILNGNAARGRAMFGFDAALSVVYVTGGAQGSRAINAVVGEALPVLLCHCQVIHQCGPRTAHGDLDDLLRLRAALPPELRDRYHARDTIGAELGDVYAAASLIVGRAGAGTVNELEALGCPAILIPLPGAEEQRQNALYLVERGSAIMLSQDQMSAETLADLVSSLLGSPARLAKMSARSEDARPLLAAPRLADELLLLAGRSLNDPGPDRSPR